MIQYLHSIISLFYPEIIIITSSTDSLTFFADKVILDRLVYILISMLLYAKDTNFRCLNISRPPLVRTYPWIISFYARDLMHASSINTTSINGPVSRFGNNNRVTAARTRRRRFTFTRRKYLLKPLMFPHLFTGFM